MEITSTYLAFLGLMLGLALAWLLLRPSRRVRHKMTRPGLRKRATAVSGSLTAFCNEREFAELALPITAGRHEIPDLDTRAEDLEAQALYYTYYLPEVEDLREQFSKRGVRERALDRVYESPESVAEIRTVSTGLLVMAQRLR